MINDLNVFRDTVIDKYINGGSIKDIADEYGLYSSAISFLISSYGLTTKKYAGNKIALRKVQNEKRTKNI